MQPFIRLESKYNQPTNSCRRNGIKGERQWTTLGNCWRNFMSCFYVATWNLRSARQIECQVNMKLWWEHYNMKLDDKMVMRHVTAELVNLTFKLTGRSQVSSGYVEIRLGFCSWCCLFGTIQIAPHCLHFINDSSQIIGKRSLELLSWLHHLNSHNVIIVISEPVLWSKNENEAQSITITDIFSSDI